MEKDQYGISAQIMKEVLPKSTTCSGSDPAIRKRDLEHIEYHKYLDVIYGKEKKTFIEKLCLAFK